VSDTIPTPTAGRLTFDAEGQEGGRFHSRHFHVPSASSGLTIGRGYDMKLRSKTEVRDDMLAIGRSVAEATLISQAAGMRGERAEEFIEENDLEDFEISLEQQVRLFDIEYQRQEKDTRRLATKADVTRAFGATDWEALDAGIKEVLVDLRYRGDYTPTSRKFLQVHVAKNDGRAFAAQICARDNWPNVPSDRFNRRKAFCERAFA
jgi:hypothetical protein